MSNFALRTIVAVALDTMHSDEGYIPPERDKKKNTIQKVLDVLEKSPTPDVDAEYFQLADEIIDFFRIVQTKEDVYRSIMERSDAPMYQAVIDTAKDDTITPVNFTFAVLIPHLYGKLKPAKPKTLNPNVTVSKIIQPGEFMGKLNVAERFFVKLVYVGQSDVTKGGTLFEVRDRNGNIGFFYEKPQLLKDKVQLLDCFAMHATPSRHTAAPNGEKHTIFRSVSIVESKGRNPNDRPDPKHDLSGGLFTKDIPFS